MDDRRGRHYTLALLSPGLAAIGFVIVVPLGIMFARSFYQNSPAGDVAAFTVENYVSFLANPTQREVLVRTILMGFAVTASTLILAFPLSYVLARSSPRVRAVGLMAVLVPLMTSVVVRSYAWMITLADNGIVVGALRLIGLPDVKLMYNMIGTVIALTHVMLPFMVMSLLGSMQQITRDLEDAARSLGGGVRHVLRDVIWPLSKPGIAAGSLLVFVLSISAYATPRLVGGAETNVMATYIYSSATSGLNWPAASAAAFILLVVVVALTGVQRRLLREKG